MWMILEHTMTSEISQSQNDILYDSTYMMLRVVKFIETESERVVARGWGRGDSGASV